MFSAFMVHSQWYTVSNSTILVLKIISHFSTLYINLHKKVYFYTVISLTVIILIFTVVRK